MEARQGATSRIEEKDLTVQAGASGVILSVGISWSMHLTYEEAEELHIILGDAVIKATGRVTHSRSDR